MSEFLAFYDGEGTSDRAVISAVELQTNIKLIRADAGGTKVLLEGVENDIRALVNRCEGWSFRLNRRAAA